MRLARVWSTSVYLLIGVQPDEARIVGIAVQLVEPVIVVPTRRECQPSPDPEFCHVRRWGQCLDAVSTRQRLQLILLLTNFDVHPCISEYLPDCLHVVFAFETGQPTSVNVALPIRDRE